MLFQKTNTGTDLDFVLKCHMIMNCEDFKIDNSKLAPGKCPSNES